MPNYLNARQAAAVLPGRPHVNTVRRWFDNGVYGVKLRSTRFGGKRLTTAQWCEEFTLALMSRDVRGLSEHHMAEAKLDQLGVSLSLTGPAAGNKRARAAHNGTGQNKGTENAD